MLGGLDYHSIAVAVKRAAQAISGLLRNTDFTAKGDVLVGIGAGLYAPHSVGVDGQSVHADSSQPSGRVYIDNPGRPNLLVNPNWQIDQINEGALYTVNAADVRGPDGWSGTAVGAGIFKLRTLADPDHPSLKCMEITCTTADAAIAAADDYFVYTAVEGYDAAALLYGEAGAKAGTIQFPFKSNVNGIYGVSIMNSAGNRRYIGTINVVDANEHDYSLSFTADNAGAWLFTNGVGVYLRICLAAGANFQAAAGAWGAGAEQTTAAQVNFMSNVANIAYLKRAQFIPGALVQAYRPADIQKELAKAQRYYAKTFQQGIVPAQNGGTTGSIFSDAAYANAASISGTWDFKSTMRAAPTIVTYNPNAANANWRDSGNSHDVTVVVSTAADNAVYLAGSTGSLQGGSYRIHATANVRLS